MTTLRFAFAVLPALLLGACATTPRWDVHAGDAVRATLAAQVLDPGALRNPDPVAGIDGRAARAAQERYEHSFKQAPQESAPPASMVGAK